MTTVDRIRQLSAKFAAWTAGHAAVRACFWYGGIGYEKLDERSDLDVALLLDRSYGADRLAAETTDWLQSASEVLWSAHLPGERRIVAWVGPDIIKVDVVYAFDAAGLEWLADAVDVPAPRLTPAWPPRCDLQELVERATISHDARDIARRREQAELEADKFVVAFEACSNAHARSDAYGFYFHYNLALGRLLRLIQLTRGGVEYLYLPRNLLAGRMSQAEQIEMRALAGSLYLPDAVRLKTALVDRFLVSVMEAETVLGIKRSSSDLRRVLERIGQRDLFFNLRDIARSFSGLVKPGRFFRSSALSRWTGRAELHRWLREAGVTDIVDVRSEVEVERMPYGSRDLDGVSLHQLPIVGPGSSQPNEEWFALAAEHAAQIRGLVAVLLQAEGAVVLHCHVGKDRTGWLCAILQAALGLPRRGIAQDYLSSRMDVTHGFVDALLTELDTRGGATAFLRSVGITDEELARLSSKLLVVRSEAQADG